MDWLTTLFVSFLPVAAGVITGRSFLSRVVVLRRPDGSPLTGARVECEGLESLSRADATGALTLPKVFGRRFTALVTVDGLLVGSADVQLDRGPCLVEVSM